MRNSLLLLTMLTLAAPAALAAKVGDITRIGGERENKITGLGLLTGLKGSGDGGEYLPAIRQLSELLTEFADPATVKELANAQNVAIVMLTAVVPASGVQEGDQLDVYVTSVGSAKSLQGGRLFYTPMVIPMRGKDKPIVGFAEGTIQIEDPSIPTNGVVKKGAIMETAWRSEAVKNGQFMLVLNDPNANWATASAIASIINDAESTKKDEILAVATDSKTVLVTIPPAERERPDSFIADVQALPVRTRPTAARVVINNKTKSIIMTGDVEIEPVVISHNGLTIQTVSPAPTPTARNPLVSSKSAIAVDTTNTGGAKLQDLVNALDQLKVPAEDRITIMQELYKTGKLHAQLIFE